MFLGTGILGSQHYQLCVVKHITAMMVMGNSCRKGNTKRKYTSRRDTFSKIAVTFEPML